MLAYSFCAFFFVSFRAIEFIGFFLLHMEAVFTSARFSLTVNVSHGTLDLVLCFVGMNFAAAFMGVDEILIFVIRCKCLCLLL